MHPPHRRRAPCDPLRRHESINAPGVGVTPRPDRLLSPYRRGQTDYVPIPCARGGVPRVGVGGTGLRRSGPVRAPHARTPTHTGPAHGPPHTPAYLPQYHLCPARQAPCLPARTRDQPQREGVHPPTPLVLQRTSCGQPRPATQPPSTLVPTHPHPRTPVQSAAPPPLLPPGWRRDPGPWALGRWRRPSRKTGSGLCREGGRVGGFRWPWTSTCLLL